MCIFALKSQHIMLSFSSLLGNYRLAVVLDFGHVVRISLVMLYILLNKRVALLFMFEIILFE